MSLLSVVIATSMKQLAQLAPGGLQEDEYRTAVELLREEIQAGYPLLVAEMKEASEAFFGNEQMLRTVLAVGCANLAAHAITKLRATRTVEVPECIVLPLS